MLWAEATTSWALSSPPCQEGGTQDHSKQAVATWVINRAACRIRVHSPLQRLDNH